MLKQRNENCGVVKVWERTGDYVRQLTAWDEGESVSIDIVSAHRAVFARALTDLCETKMPARYTCPLSLDFFRQALAQVEAVYGSSRGYYCIATDKRRERVYVRALRRMGYAVDASEGFGIIRWQS